MNTGTTTSDDFDGEHDILGAYAGRCAPTLASIHGCEGWGGAIGGVGVGGWWWWRLEGLLGASKQAVGWWVGC